MALIGSQHASSDLDRLLRVWPKRHIPTPDRFHVMATTRPLPDRTVPLSQYKQILQRLHPTLTDADAAAMRLRHLVFGAVDENVDGSRLIALVQARAVEAGESLSADYLHFDDEYVDDVLNTARAVGPTVVCDNAATLEGDYEGLGITQSLIAFAVIEYLMSHPRFRSYRWLTSSPATDGGRCARVLAGSPALEELVDLVDGCFRELRPFSYSSVGEVIGESMPFLRRFGFFPAGAELSLAGGRGKGELMGLLLRSMRTEAELREAEGAAGERAEEYRGFVARLATPCASGPLSDSHRAAKVLAHTLSLMLQSDLYYASDKKMVGHIADATSRFHYHVGGVRGGGPIPYSRRQHAASLFCGQRFAYTASFKEAAERYRALVGDRRAEAERRGVLQSGVQTLTFDRDRTLEFVRDGLLPYGVRSAGGLATA